MGHHGPRNLLPHCHVVHTHKKACCYKCHPNLRSRCGVQWGLLTLSPCEYLTFQEMWWSVWTLPWKQICPLAVPQSSTESKYNNRDFLVFLVIEYSAGGDWTHNPGICNGIERWQKTSVTLFPNAVHLYTLASFGPAHSAHPRITEVEMCSEKHHMPQAQVSRWSVVQG